MEFATVRSIYYQILSVMLSALCVSACCSDNTTGPDSARGAARDKQIRLPFVSTNDIAASDTVWYTGGPFHTLIDFDIRDYPGVDSAVLIGFMLRANRKDDAASVMNPTLYLYRR